ncbi:Exosome complex component rrp42 [Vermiconidia calcicola]|uniref:Exosome complex component rrp42 n=1 Tax=Vermiconidia calcicola TaxID=1690605 RepID=A0ACC3NNT7_9PEZI|nr:Exosome complex component rrp42 [Vermiconidia calcicola]
MAPFTNIPLSPAELAYLHSSLSQNPPIRPDGRSPTQFRPLIAETDILPSPNGSARICFADGTEAIVGIKAEVEKSRNILAATGGVESEGVLGLGTDVGQDVDMDEVEDDQGGQRKNAGKGEESWVEAAIEIPGMRDDDALPIFLSAMLTEALLADGELKDRLWINRRFHWRLYIDVLLLSQPLSYPLPLLSLTTHLALLSTRIPALVSEKDEDPLFNDDWEASHFLYPRSDGMSMDQHKPPVTLLVMSVGENIIFDPSKEELAVADSVVAISAVGQTISGNDGALKMIALRTIDPPSRLTGAGVPNSQNTTTGGTAVSAAEAFALREKDQGQTVWRPPRGGVKRTMIAKMIKMVVEKGGVGQEVLGALANVES